MPGWLSRTSWLERKAAHAFRLKNYPAAIRHLRDLLERVGENPNTLHVLGLCHERLGAHDDAFACAKRAVSADGNHFEALRLLIRLHLRRGEDREARALVEHALACLPSPVVPRRFRWIVRFLVTDNDPSLDGFDRELREWIRWARAFVDREQTLGERISN